MNEETVIGEDDGPIAGALSLFGGTDWHRAKTISLVMLEELMRRDGSFSGDNPVRESDGGNHGQTAGATTCPCEERHVDKVMLIIAETELFAGATRRKR